MDLTTIITIVIILFCIVLFVLQSRKKKQKEAQLLQPLFKLAENNNCKISKHERLNNSFIGIDEVANIVFVVSNVNNIESSQQIDLADILKCRVIESSRSVSTKEGSIKVVDKIELSLVFISIEKYTSSSVQKYTI
ncbi:MAG: hypothetical protein WC384_22900 [Prolixibacteraceae bacterium]|jgi:hypothetical protein